MKKIWIAVLALAMLLLLAGCGCEHEWEEANCEKPKTCKLCDETEGELGDHTWEAATCLLPETCSVCQETRGEALGHSWVDATCTAPKSCENCDATEGEALGHTWAAATCALPETCSICQETQGAPLGHTWIAATCTAPKTCQVCNGTEGEALGHTWEAATCILPEKCTVCHETQGNALGHNWQEATTEAPKTCTRCWTTEGSRLITDSRFTTASTKQLHGKWSCDVFMDAEMLGTTGYFDGLNCTVYYEFGKTGEVKYYMQVHNLTEFEAGLEVMMVDQLYTEFANMGYSKAESDQAMQQAYGMTVAEYAEAYVEAMDLKTAYSQVEVMVYYVSGSKIYMATNWNSTFDSSEYTLNNGVLVIESDTLEDGGEPLQWKRVS